MPKGVPSIDMKKDETRTIKSKMGIRATYAGKGRNHALALEGAKEVRLLEHEKRLAMASMGKEQKEMKKKMMYLKNLLVENRQRRLSVSDDGTATQENDSTVTDSGTTKPSVANVKEYPYKTDIVNSTQGLKTMDMSKKAKDIYLKRTLHELQSTFTHNRENTTLNEIRLKRMRENISKMGKSDRRGLVREKSTIRKARGKNGVPGAEISEPLGDKVDSDARESGDNVFVTRGHVPKHSLNFPELPPVSKAGSSILPKRTSLSQLISSGHFTALPAIQDHRQAKSTSGATVEGAAAANSENAAGEIGSTKSEPPPTRTLPKRQPDLRKKAFVPLIGPPVPYYQAPIQENPFETSAIRPNALRSRDLIEHRKADEMYVWLGFESEQEFLEHHQTKDKKSIQQDKSILSTNSIDAVIEEEGEQEGSEHDEDSDSEDEKGDAKEFTRGRSFVRQASKLGKPMSLITDAAVVRANPFVKSANAVLIVRQFQMNVES
ncbi:uncharacterized protein [Ptychodera flava]|uniref:uncharacterized protein n=1 Tax=Ptychodera flava TaxID=63121 RepID=UPI00396A3D7D